MSRKSMSQVSATFPNWTAEPSENLMTCTDSEVVGGNVLMFEVWVNYKADAA
jgi:hypothetical protein